MFKKVSLSTLVLLLPMWSMGSEFLGNWTQYYLLADSEGQSLTLSHTPKRVCLSVSNGRAASSMCAGRGLHMNTVINDIWINNLVVSVDSTQEEFEKGISESNLRIVKQSKTAL